MRNIGAKSHGSPDCWFGSTSGREAGVAINGIHPCANSNRILPRAALSLLHWACPMQGCTRCTVPWSLAPPPPPPRSTIDVLPQKGCRPWRHAPLGIAPSTGVLRIRCQNRVQLRFRPLVEHFDDVFDVVVAALSSGCWPKSRLHPTPEQSESKGVVERRNGWFETSFIPGRTFDAPQDFNTQFSDWLVLGTSRIVLRIKTKPVDLLATEDELCERFGIADCRDGSRRSLRPGRRRVPPNRVSRAPHQHHRRGRRGTQTASTPP